MRKLIFISVIFLALQTTVWAEENEGLDAVLGKIEDKYEGVKDFYARFTQEATVRALDKVQESEGEFWFKKPGKLRWNYYKPEKQEYVSDGNTLWFYNHEEKQVVESSLDKVININGNTTSSLPELLSNLKNRFNARFSQDKYADENGSYVIDLIPKEESEGYNKITISADKESMIVETVYFYDAFGNLTKIKLHDIKINKGISDSLFEFKVPKGVEVIRTPSSVSQ